MRRSVSAGIVSAAVLLLGLATFTQPSFGGSAQGGAAQDITGGFISFADGVLTIHVKGGHLRGDHKFQIPDGIPVLVYTSPGHPKTSHAPGGLQDVAPNTRVQVTVDTRNYIVRVTVGEKD